MGEMGAGLGAFGDLAPTEGRGSRVARRSGGRDLAALAPWRGFPAPPASGRLPHPLRLPRAGLRPQTLWFPQPQGASHTVPADRLLLALGPHPQLAGNTNQMLGLWPVGGWEEVAVRGGLGCRRGLAAFRPALRPGDTGRLGPSERQRCQASPPRAVAPAGRPKTGRPQG